MNKRVKEKWISKKRDGNKKARVRRKEEDEAGNACLKEGNKTILLLVPH